MLFVAMSATVFTSCNKNDETEPEIPKTALAYIINYGDYFGSNGEISVYNTETETITDASAYKTANSVDYSSKIESMAIVDSTAYLMGNNGDKIDILNANTLKQTINPITSDIVKPRFMLAVNNTAYISCWGDVQDWVAINSSYIAKIDLTTNSVTKKIPVSGGLEGMIVVDGNLYIAQTATNKVAVLNLATDAVSYITMPAVPQHFVIGEGNKIYVSLVTKYSTPFPAEKLGVAVINPSTNTVVETINIPSIGDNGFIHISDNLQTLFVLAKEAWPGTKSFIKSVNLTTKTVTDLISGESFNGFNVNPKNNDIYILLAPSATEKGTLKIYDNKGSLLDTEEVGISPKHIVFYDAK